MTPAQLAGARGRSAEPMSNDKRIDAYERQNGHARGPLTPRQERRVTKKARGRRSVSPGIPAPVPKSNKEGGRS